MADPQFPNVPAVAGVPPVFRQPGSAATVATPALTKDSPAVASGSRTTWGIYKTDGTIALAVDNIAMVEPMREFRMSDYPTEEGGFQSYNKVATPGEVRIRVTKGGSDADRSAFLARLDAMIETVATFFNVVMPDQTLMNRSVTRYDYERSATRGVTLLTVEITLVEVRQGAAAAFTDSKAPEGSAQVQGGPVQASPATIQQRPPPAATLSPAAQQAIEDNPVPFTPSQTPAQSATAATGLIGAGATINDLSALGCPFSAIPTLASPAQTLTTQLAGQAVRLAMTQRSGGLFADVYVNDALIIGGVLCQNDNAIVRSPYLGFAGDLYFHDTQGGLGDIGYADLGGRVVLLFAGA